ncbi:scarecrow-like protein 32-like [Hibiscus syriacus]|uniref:Scarecrow-like protein 32-like n=1 Tax=Hibiscus syriacus TaxID=106335 RepID=A0A6A2Y2I3_HIBSY|nr:scarecrow-like protein 32-like [Hibiscus syriacus]
MAVCCDLEVDVNGEETFLLDKEIICSFSGRLSKLFGKSTGAKRSRVIFHDFPGGAGNFELISRFCYSNGKIDINPSNISSLYSAARFMEMNDSVSGNRSLFEKIERSVEEIGCWTWSDLVVALKHGQDLQQAATSSGILERCLDSLVARLVTDNEASPCASTSSDSLGFRLSCDTKSTESSKQGFSRHLRAGSSSTTKVEVSLFGILRVVLNLNISKSSRSKLEDMIGSQLDQATLDNLLIPSPYGTSYMYDVNLVLKFLKAFLRRDRQSSPIRTKKVGSLIRYIAEVAPDPYLKPSKFRALVTALPDSARDSEDELYHSIDIYLEVHTGLCEEERIKICCALNYEKLSTDACIHLSQNAKFGSKSAVQALASRQLKLKNFLQGTNHTDSSCKFTENEKLDISADNEKLREHLQGMQSRVMELEKVCTKMQNQMAKFMKSKEAAAHTHTTTRSMPRFC